MRSLSSREKYFTWRSLKLDNGRVGETVVCAIKGMVLRMEQFKTEVEVLIGRRVR